MLRHLLKQAYQALPLKRQLFEPLRRLGLSESVYRHLHFTGPFYVPLDRDRGFIIEHRGAIVENELFWSGIGGGWEAKSNRIWAALCEGQSGLILDVGANSGVYSLIAAAVADPEATIIAFEPIGPIAELLRRNVDLNGGKIRIQQIAASDRDGFATIYDFDDDFSYSASIERPFPGAGREYQVPTARLDTLLENHEGSGIAAAKIDVEGHEAAVMRGMQQATARWKPPLLIEILDEEAGMKIEAIIDGLGYQRWQIDENAGLIRSDSLCALGGRSLNMLLCTAEDFRDRGIEQFLAPGQH